MLNKCLQLHQLKQNQVQLRRFITANQAAHALRPFFFLVHPDRFARSPEVASKNEKSLQIFNGYLNELIPQGKQFQAPPPTRVTFSIMKDGRFENVTLILQGSDPVQIIKEALNKCNLSVQNVPESKTQSKPTHTPYPSTSSSSFNSAKWATPEDLWQDLRMKDTQRRNPKKRTFYANAQSLLNNLVQNRDLAIERCKTFEKTNDLLNDEIEYLKQKTGAKSISWSIGWHDVYYLRCLKNLQLLIEQADAKTQQIINKALHSHDLIFGRSSFICVDGSIQFGADDVPETWLSICRESNVRRFELANVRRLVERVRELLGYANILIDDKSNLLQTTHQLQSLIVRVSSQARADRDLVGNLARDTFVQISNSYSSLALFANGRIQIPCNVNGQLLIEFLQENSKKSIQMHNEMLHRQARLEDLRKTCVQNLKLIELTWETNISIESLLDCIERLTRADEAVRNQTNGLRIKISTNSNFHVLPDGSLSLPVNFST